MSKIRTLVSAAILAAVLCVPAAALAIPTLQIYIEGSGYDTGTDTWTLTGTSAKLWILGDVSHDGAISNVLLTIAYPAGLAGTITLSPITATGGLLPLPGDPSTPGGPTLVGAPASATGPGGSSPCGPNGTVGTLPCLDDGSKLPSHGIYGAGIQWKEFALGNMTLADSPIGDFSGATAFPTSFPDLGQINAYDVSVSGFPLGTFFHFDVFGNIQGPQGTVAVNAPFSHDADLLDNCAPGQVCQRVPEPASLALLGAGGLALAWLLLRRRLMAARARR